MERTCGAGEEYHLVRARSQMDLKTCQRIKRHKSEPNELYWKDRQAHNGAGRALKLVQVVSVPLSA